MTPPTQPPPPPQKKAWSLSITSWSCKNSCSQSRYTTAVSRQGAFFLSYSQQKLSNSSKVQYASPPLPFVPPPPPLPLFHPYLPRSSPPPLSLPPPPLPMTFLLQSCTQKEHQSHRDAVLMLTSCLAIIEVSWCLR